MNDYDAEAVMQRNAEMIKQAQNLLGQADAARAERDRLFEQAGVSFAAVREFLQSEALSSEERAAIQAEMTRYEQELADEHAHIAAQHASQTTGHQPRRMNTRNMV